MKFHLFDWSTRVTLASVFTTTADTSAEHALENGTIVLVTGITIRYSNVLDINALEGAWIGAAWVLGIAPSTNADSLTRFHPFPSSVAWQRKSGHLNITSNFKSNRFMSIRIYYFIHKLSSQLTLNITLRTQRTNEIPLSSS